MKNWQSLERHPISADYADLDGPAWAIFLDGMRQEGFDPLRPIVTHEGKILDGWQRQRAAVELDIEPKYIGVPKGTDPEAFVVRHNDQRRHETDAARAKRIEARRVRVATAHASGESLRAIAEKEGVDKKTVQKDLEKTASGDRSPPAPENTKNPANHQAKSEKGKKIPDSENICDRCKRVGKTKGCEKCAELKGKSGKKSASTTNTAAPKPTATPRNGKAIFKEKEFEKAYGAFMRTIDKRGSVVGKDKNYQKLVDLMGEIMQHYQAWKKVSA